MTAEPRRRWRPTTGRRASDATGRRRDRRRPSLLTRYGVTSLLLFAALGTLLGTHLTTSVERRVVSMTLREAEVVACLGIERLVLPDELATGFTDDREEAIDRALTAELRPLGVLEVSIYGLGGELIYASERGTVGTRPDDAQLDLALDGESTAVILDVHDHDNPFLRRQGEVLDAYLPLQFGHTSLSPHDGVVRVTLPYAPIAATIRQDTRTLYVVLAVALAVLYAVLFRLVAGASRALRRQAATNEYQALHDELTGLPNRTLFKDRLDHAIDLCQRGDGGLAVMLMDLDRFKEVNDTLGHHHGDLLLEQVAMRLCETLRVSDTVARLGGDEFAFLLPDVDTEAAAIEVARKVHAALDQHFDVRGLSLDVGASIGIALHPAHADTSEALLQRADVAMYAAKRDQRGHAVYDAAVDDHSRDRLVLTAELRKAIERGELVVHHQPKYDLATGAVAGAEALVRWDHPTRGLLGPGHFIPVAETTDLIRVLTEKVLDLALRDCRSWMDQGHQVGVAVNLSVRNLHGDDLPQVVARLLARHGVPPELLTLEITETMIAADPRIARTAVVELRRLGVRLAIDDFGTGYSSLAVLRGLPVHELKIDRSFVHDMTESPDADAIVGFSCELGHQLGLDVVAEGVETEDAVQRLTAIGCDLAQGYWYSRPVPVDEVIALMNAKLVEQHLGLITGR